MVKDLYYLLGTERRELQAKGELPEWITTPAWQMLKEKYLEEGETLKTRYREIARAAAKHISPDFEDCFFKLMWDGFLSPSTPVLSNMGRKNFTGMPVSCSGSYVEDSVEGFYSSQLEAAVLSKNGFGTSVYLGDIRPRGSKIRNMSGSASGILPVLRDFTQVAVDISQGESRRGAIACYIPIEHKDFDEIVTYVTKQPDDVNIGWNIPKSFIDKLDSGDEEALRRYQRALKMKMVTGKGYFFFPDKVNALNPKWYKDKSVEVKASNLCCEISLPSNEEETFTCVLSSMNLAKYDSWKDTDAIMNSTIFLYCVAKEFIALSEGIKGLEKARNFTINHMALGLGVLGFHTYLQSKDIPWGSLECHYKNTEIFKDLKIKTERANEYLFSLFGPCKMTEGYPVACSHLTAIAPTLSTALICGSVSQGIEPIYKNFYIQNTSAGKLVRINPYVMSRAKKAEVSEAELSKALVESDGSTQGFDWLTDQEKKVTRTAFEISQESIIALAASRQRFITQSQSINLFFAADTPEEVISAIHKEAFKDEYIKGLYYIRSDTGIKHKEVACEACAS